MYVVRVAQAQIHSEQTFIDDTDISVWGIRKFFKQIITRKQYMQIRKIYEWLNQTSNPSLLHSGQLLYH